MSVTISNNLLTARIATFGAELKSLHEHATGSEYIWRADPEWWNGSAPILFPIVGGLKNGTYRFNGTTYAMPQHGVVRKKDWELVSAGGDTAVFRTVSDADTRVSYPFDFTLLARFGLQGNSLTVQYEVRNTGTGTMYFSIGSHPAFSLPFAGGYMEHYYFHFSQAETLERYFFDDGLHLNHTAPVFDNCQQVFMRADLFDDGPIIFKNPVSRDVTIMNSRNRRRIRVATDGAPYMALWSKPGAPFVCIEPWHGIPDNIDTDGDLTSKEGIMALAAGATYTTWYRVDIL